MPKFHFITLLVLFSLTARAESILIIGDSISCGPFGNELIKNLTAAGNEVRLYCAVSSRPDHWMNGTTPKGQRCQTRHSGSPALWPCDDNSTRVPKFSDILKRNPSDRVMIALGTNTLPEKLDRAYTEMIAAIRTTGRACDWIGPPHLQPTKPKTAAGKHNIQFREDGLNKFYADLKPKIEGVCDLLDSRAATQSGVAHETGEGIHPTEKAAAARFQAMKADIMSKISPPGRSSTERGSAKTSNRSAH